MEPHKFKRFRTIKVPYNPEEDAVYLNGSKYIAIKMKRIKADHFAYNLPETDYPMIIKAAGLSDNYILRKDTDGTIYFSGVNRAFNRTVEDSSLNVNNLTRDDYNNYLKSHDNNDD